MASWQMRAVALYVRATRKKRYATREAGLAFLHSAKGPSDPPAKALGDSRVSTHRARGRDVHVVRGPVSYTHLRAHETVLAPVCRLLLEKKTKKK